jgi:hypothetical protein
MDSGMPMPLPLLCLASTRAARANHVSGCSESLGSDAEGVAH